MLLAVYFYEDFVDVERVAIAPMLSPQSSSVYCIELDTPEADSLAADGDAPFG